MKICSKCGLEKIETDFRKWRTGCKACEKVAAAKRREDPEYREAQAVAEQKRREVPEYVTVRRAQSVARRAANPEHYRRADRKCTARRRRFLNLLKMERPCYDCGGMFPPEATDWDHLPGKEKCFNIGPGQASVSLEACIDEINKCQLVCSNCHRIRTQARKQKKGTGS